MEPLTLFPREPDRPRAVHFAPGEHVERRSLLRRLLVLLAAAATAFSLTTWWFVYLQSSPSLLNSAEPAGVVRQQLAALNRGDVQSAYEQFSERYRHTVSLELFKQLVASHRSMFRTREVQFQPGQQSPDRQVLQTYILAADGRRYVAQFILRRLQGRWWIDDVHWGSECGRRHLTSV